MKKRILIMAVVSLGWAGSREEISMLNQQILHLEDQSRNCRETNASIQESNRAFEVRVSQLTTDLQKKDLEIEEKDAKILQLQNQLRLALQAQEAAEAEQQQRVASQRPTTSSTSPFPIMGSILSKEPYGPSNIKMLFSFTNRSAEALSGFEGLVTFSQNGQVLSEVSLAINQNMPSGQNVTWLGAIPYNSTDGNSVRLYNAEASTIDVSIIVTSVTLTNGVKRSY